MWVDVIQTRQHGRKLPQARLETMVPVRARLWVTVMRGWAEDGERRPMTASLLGARGGDEIQWRQLDRARVKIRDGQIMVLGYEDHGYTAKSPKPVPQVWWCDPVRDPLDEQEARAKAKFPPTLGKAHRAAAQGNVAARAAGLVANSPAD
jgi:hypothetical protein